MIFAGDDMILHMEMQELDKVCFALHSSIPCGSYALPQEVWQKQAIRTFQDHITP